jgi:phosphoenolpyruvate-protein kinase (PTS system EI component)
MQQQSLPQKEEQGRKGSQRPTSFPIPPASTAKPLQLPESALEIAHKQIKQLEARLAVVGHVLIAHLQREVSEADDKKERENEKMMPTSLILLADPDYASRFQVLLKTGWSMQEVHSALQITALSDNYSSVQRAHAHLQAEQGKEMREVIERCADELSEGAKAPKRILQTSALVRVLRERPDAGRTTLLSMCAACLK